MLRGFSLHGEGAGGDRAVHVSPSCCSRRGSVPAPVGSVMLRIPTVAMTHLLKGFLEHVTHSSSALGSLPCISCILIYSKDCVGHWPRLQRDSSVHSTRAGHLGHCCNDHVAVGSWGILFLCCRTCPAIASVLFLFFMTSLQREKSSPGVPLQVQVCVLWLWSGVCVCTLGCLTDPGAGLVSWCE